MAVTRETVDSYARLANLSFSEEEAETMAHQLGTILEYVQKISELDLSDVPATARVFQTAMPMREDLPGASISSKEALANAPDRESGHFLVPKVIHIKH